MSLSNSDRVDYAKSIPIMEVVDRLQISGLRPAGREKVGPCPVCGGNDRFSINPDRGVFNCRACALGGDGIKLVEHSLGCNFVDAVKYLAGDDGVNIDPKELERRKKKSEAESRKREAFARRMRQKAISDARTIWSKAVPAENTHVSDYLAGRGLYRISIPPSIRFIPDHPYVKKIGKRLETLHSGPCMIAGIQSANGKITAVHQTWINPDQPGVKSVIVHDGERLPSKMVRGSKKGGAIRLSKTLSPLVMVVGEGIETTLTALKYAPLPDATYWCAVDLGNMAGRMQRIQGQRYSGLPDMTDKDAFIPPMETKQLIYIQDGDSDPEPTYAKMMCGLRRAMRSIPELKTKIVHPGEGVDLNDLIQ